MYHRAIAIELRRGTTFVWQHVNCLSLLVDLLDTPTATAENQPLAFSRPVKYLM